MLKVFCGGVRLYHSRAVREDRNVTHPLQCGLSENSGWNRVNFMHP